MTTNLSAAMDEDANVAAIIAAQNDLFRKSLMSGAAAVSVAQHGIQGRVLLTPGVSGEGEVFQQSVMAAVAVFDTFTENNDPYGDHSFGAFEVAGEKLFWKIDLYDLSFKYGSEDPANPKATQRALTIMLRSEY